MHPNLYEVEKALRGEGHQFLFLVSSIGPSERGDERCRVVALNGSGWTSQIEQILADFSPDLVIQRIVNRKFVSMWRRTRRANIPIVLYNQDPLKVSIGELVIRPLRVLRMCKDLVRNRLLLGPHFRITPVHYWGSNRGIRIPKTFYLPFPMPLKKNSGRPPNSPPVVSVVAKHGQTRKRVSWAVRALRDGPALFKLNIIGSSPPSNHRIRALSHRRLLRRISRLGSIAGQITVFSDLDGPELDRIYGRSDLFVLPSKREPFAVSPLEAMSHGVPVLVGSDGGGVSYVLPAGKEQVFSARSYQSFNAKLQALLSDEHLRLRLSRAVVDRIATHHSAKSFVAHLEEIRRVSTL